MNDLRAKYIWQVGHYVSGHRDNMENVDEKFLRELEERAGIKEDDVIFWRYSIHREFLDGYTTSMDKRMGYILFGIGETN